jgi:hypothetical protein
MFKIATPKVTLEAPSMDALRELHEFWVEEFRGEKIEKSTEPTEQGSEEKTLAAEYSQVEGVGHRRSKEEIEQKISRLESLRTWKAKQGGPPSETKTKFKTL